MQQHERVSLVTAICRFLTGAHLDGKKYTNATWLKPGTMPKAQVTWWTGKPRLHRMAIRWAGMLIPAAWVYLFWRFNFWTLFLTVAWLPYSFHNAWHFIAKRTKQTVYIGSSVGYGDDQNVIADLEFPIPEAKSGRKAQ